MKSQRAAIVIFFQEITKTSVKEYYSLQGLGKGNYTAVYSAGKFFFRLSKAMNETFILSMNVLSLKSCFEWNKISS